MKVLVTGCGGKLGAAVLAHLQASHDSAGCGEDLRQPAEVRPLVAGLDAVVHVAAFEPGPLSGPRAEQDRLDIAARSAYVLLDEAARARVSRAVLISRLSLMAAYPEDYVLDPQFRPRPGADAESLAPYTAELAFREFAREGRISAVCLRFGAIGVEGGTSSSDAMEAVDCALKVPFGAPGYRWLLYHIATNNPRFPLRSAAAEPFCFRGGA